MKNPLPLNTNGGRGFLASTPHMVLHNTMWGVDAKNLLPLLVLSIVIIFPKFAECICICRLSGSNLPYYNERCRISVVYSIVDLAA